MKFLYFGLVILVCFSIGECNRSDGLDATNSHKRGLFGGIGRIIEHIPGVKGLKHDLWDIIQSFDVCEVRCTGKICHCCQKANLAFIHLTVCFNGDLKPAEKEFEISFSTRNHKLIGHSFSYEKYQSVCNNISVLSIDGEVCINVTTFEYKENGITICGHLDVKLKGIETVQLNLECLNYDGDITLNGRTDIDNKTLAFIRVLNPIKFVELVKRIFLD